jgi:subtilisin family serine protease
MFGHRSRKLRPALELLEGRLCLSGTELAVPAALAVVGHHAPAIDADSPTGLALEVAGETASPYLFIRAAEGNHDIPRSSGILQHEMGHSLGFRHEHTRPTTDNGHGTHVAGTIGGQPDALDTTQMFYTWSVTRGS